MHIQFPKQFLWGSSTAAAQVESATDHPWNGLKASDGYVFSRTTEHEKHRAEDAVNIARFGTIYRCGVDWSRLQTAPMTPFNPVVVQEYCTFFDDLTARGMKLMFVLHHFCHPNWFENNGGWTTDQNTAAYLHFTEQCIQYFGKYVSHWNTFNEPNVYAMNAFILGNFPPCQKGRYFTANRVLDNMGKAHDAAYHLLKKHLPEIPVGISFNTGWFEGANFLGKRVAAFVDWWFLERAARPFEQCDFWGLSYYAYMLFDPLPIDAQTRMHDLQKRGIPHDKMWGYKPEGLGHILRRFYHKYKKPIIITENGICTDDDQQRIQSIRDYLTVCFEAMQEGVPLQGYIHWSTWDNFEWHLGPTFRFGLVRIDLETMERRMTAAGEFYEKLTSNGQLST
jgi:beta-glucosidase